MNRPAKPGWNNDILTMRHCKFNLLRACDGSVNKSSSYYYGRWLLPKFVAESSESQDRAHWHHMPCLLALPDMGHSSHFNSLVKREAADMESSSAVHIPVRSISLPSRLQPTFHNIESELRKLRSWESTVPSGSETIQLRLVRVAGLYNCLQELIHSPLTQKALHRHQYPNLVEEAFDGSVELLDVCGNARDLFFMMKEHVNDLQSALRRRGGSSSIEGNIQAYICFRKKVIKKDITKCIKTLKRMETNDIESFPVMDSDHLSFLVKVIREVRAITRSMLRSLMLFLSVPVMKTKGSGWLLVSKLLLTSERSQKTLNELGAVDAAVYTIHGQIRRNNDDAKVDVQEVQKRLERLDGRIKGFEGELDCLFRCLIQNRVSLLNLVTP
ncbi:uncharacterized protein LOC120015088 [Tripterygium wilfordii]|nr:uncharacterized protein LOC120015088 [Tripterygium wilfordii]